MDFLEAFDEVGGAVEPDLICNFGYGGIGVFEQSHRQFYPLVAYELRWGHPQNGLELSMELPAAHVHGPAEGIGVEIHIGDMGLKYPVQGFQEFRLGIGQGQFGLDPIAVPEMQGQSFLGLDQLVDPYLQALGLKGLVI